MTKANLYPLTFVPIIKDKVWGGAKLSKLLQKNASHQAGESWELSGVANDVSVVASGALKGMELGELISIYKGQLVGEGVYSKFGDQFPLLFKFIDAREDLSVQLHPNDTIAKRRHNSFGKTEMWYVLQTDKDARLILGFNRDLTKEAYTELLENNSITSVLHSKPVKKGEVYFIAPGLVHAIGAGVLLAEIQQTSDITYRIYDWDRPDMNGSLRELHTAQALDAIDFNNDTAERFYSNKLDQRVLLDACPYFVTHKLVLTRNFKVTNFIPTSFKTYMCIDGGANFVTKTTTVAIEKGQTILLPASMEAYEIETKNATFLEVYIP